MSYKIIFIILFTFLLLGPGEVNAFLPPEFFVQGINSLLAVVSAGVAVAIFPLLVFIRFIKKYFDFNKNKKIIIFLIIQPIIIAVVLGIFFYYKFYKPLYEDAYLFPRVDSSGIDPLDKTIEPFISGASGNYTILEGVRRDVREKLINYDYGIKLEEIKKEIDDGRKIYYLDIREVEEFNIGHITGAKNFRHADIKDVDTIRNIFGLSEGEFKDALIVLYCHDGDRGFYTARQLDQKNIKYLIGGTEELMGKAHIEYTGAYLSDKELFGKEYQTKFQVSAKEAIKNIIGGNAFIVDMRLGRVFFEKHIKGSLHFLYNTMPQNEYEARLGKVLKNKEKNIIFIVDRYAELFYTNLLIMRLKKEYGFNDGNFHVLFHQVHLLEENSLIKFEHGYYPEIL